MRILLTGASGFIGQEVRKILSKNSFDVYAVSRTKQPLIKNSYCLDLLDFQQTTLLVKKIRPHVLIHLAWDVTHGDFWTSPENIAYADASVSLFESFIKIGGEKIISSGTCAEYVTSSLGVDESMDCDDRELSIYGREKKRVVKWLQQANIDFAWARIFGIYGKNENPQRFFPSMIDSIRSGRDFYISNPAVFADYVNVCDVASFIAQCVDYKDVGVINLGTGNSCSLYDLYKAVEFYMNCGTFLLKKTINDPDKNSRIPDCKKLHSFGCKYKLESGFKTFKEINI